jgi:pantothenate kinase
MSKWVDRMIARGVSPEVIEQRIAQRKLNTREWAEKNKERKYAHKRAYKARLKKANTQQGGYEGVIIKSAYHPNWKEVPVYHCPELTYRGKHD